MTDALNLRALVREILAETDEADPGAIARTVMGRIPTDKQGEALIQTLRLFVRQIISENRITRPQGVTHIGAARSAGRSWKGAALREAWREKTRDRLHVGHGEWKQLRDCTYADLMSAAAERQDHAERNAAWAQRYRHYALALSNAGVDTFGELPTATQADLLEVA